MAPLNAKPFFAILFLFMLVKTTSAQRSANWFFGNKAGVRFTASGPVAVTGSLINTLEGCSSMSDDNGNLLFYTDGQTVWNKSHAIMNNGTGLKGGNSSAQSSIVVPDPGNANRYYIFTASPNGNTFRKYCYNIVDMSLQAGLGEVITKNVEFDDNCSERITAAQHGNGKDFWIITNPHLSNKFNAFQLTSAGLSTTPVTSLVGRTNLQIWGMCKVSSDGNWLIQTSATTMVTAQLFRFNSSTGVLSNVINLNVPTSTGSYGCAFSPDSKRLYLSTSFATAVLSPNGLLQYTLTSGLEATINSSRTAIPVPPNTGPGIGDLSLGPDDRLYMSRVGTGRISCLRKPNDSAASAQFLDTAVLFPTGSVSQYGLPNFYNNINIPPDIKIKVDTLSCFSFRFSFNSFTSYNYKGIFSWDFGDGSALSTDSLATHTFQRTSNDSFLIKFNFRSPDNTVDINIQRWFVLPKKPIAGFTAPTQGCFGPAVNINSHSISTNGTINQYSWWLGDGTTSSNQSLTKNYTDTGTYTIKLVVRDSLGCLSDTGSQTLIINKRSFANFELMGPYCRGVALQLVDSSKVHNSTINKWWYGISNGNQFNSTTTGNFATTFSTEGNYTIRAVVNTPEGCISDTISKTYFVYNTPTANFSLPQSCIADIVPFVSTSTMIGASSINYWKWDFGVGNTLADTSRTSVTNYQYTSAAQYPVKLLVVTNQGCKDSLTQNFTVNGSLPKANLAFLQTPICGRDSVVLVNQSTVDFGSLISMEILWGTSSVIDNNPLPNGSYKFKYPEFGIPASKNQAIRLTVSSGVNCKSQLDTFIVLNAQPKVQFNVLADVCGNALPFDLNQGTETTGAVGSFSYSGNGVSNASANKYTFDPNSVAQGSISNIKYRFATPAGCVDSAYRPILVLAYPTADAGPNMVQLEGGQVTLQAIATGNGLTYGWQPALYATNPTSLKPTVSVVDDTTMLLTVTNHVGCIDTSSVFIKLLRTIIPPNAFTPNGDGINDYWAINNLHTYQQSKVQVFNRQGQELFRSIGYNKPWDGTYNGKPLPAATYYYIIELGNGGKRVSGWVQLIK